jgi:hypothetical protein
MLPHIATEKIPLNPELKHFSSSAWFMQSRLWVLPSRLILFDLTFSLVPVPFFLLASVAFKVSALVSLR